MPVLRDSRGRFVSRSSSQISVVVDVETTVRRVENAAEKAAYKNIRHALFSISKAAKASIKKSKEPSEAGTPPNTRGRGRHNVRGAIYTAADKFEGIAGPRHSYVGESGRAHEFGEEFEGDDFEERPFMGPQLKANAPRFAASWHGSIGE